MLKIKDLKVNNILSNIDISFEQGKTYVIMGKNGIGKSTLLHAIMGRPDLDVSGSIVLNNIDISEHSVSDRAKLGLFMGFQSPTSIPGLSNFQLIKQAKNSTGADLVQDLKQFKQLANDLDLPSDWDRKSVNTEASGGQKKKNELIQMGMLDINIAMLDEPDSGLDVDGVDSLIKVLNDWKQDHRTLIVVAHYEKLISGINPDVVVNITEKGAITGGRELADKIFKTGFKDV
jgi:Fe-S cluster assembly ATP-binding protein